MLNRRKSIETQSFSWQIKDAPCWLLNDNILPSSRMFLPCRIKEQNPIHRSEYIKVLLDDQKYLMELKVKKGFLYQRSEGSREKSRKKSNLLESNMKGIQEEDPVRSSIYDSMFGSNAMDQIKDDLYASLCKAFMKFVEIISGFLLFFYILQK